MPGREDYAQLGRADAWLRGVGLLIWASVGLIHLSSRGPGDPMAWLAPWIGYGLALVGAAFHARLPLWLARALVGVQSLAVALMPSLGFQGLEGLLLAIVVAQLPMVFTLPQSALLALVQLPLLLAIVFPFQQPRFIFEILGAHSAFVIFALLGYRIQQRERKARTSLSEAYAELVETRALLVENSRQGERLRISRELHDSLGHHLVALGIQLQLAEKLTSDSGRGAVTRAQGISREALAEVRNVVTAMQAPQQLDFGASLKALASRIPTPHIHIDLNAELVLPDPERAHALFRCVQEAITNSVKHAEARNVWVTVRTDANAVDIKVRDDGHGARKLVEGNGLTGIRERLGGLGGSAVFGSEAGRGFELHLTAPLGRTAS
jgi:signal transduction histidine kinase